MKYSLTFAGIITMFVGTLLVSWGFSETCSSEITQKLVILIPLIPGALMALKGRLRLGGVSVAGFRKGPTIE